MEEHSPFLLVSRTLWMVKKDNLADMKSGFRDIGGVLWNAHLTAVKGSLSVKDFSLSLVFTV